MDHPMNFISVSAIDLVKNKLFRKVFYILLLDVSHCSNIHIQANIGTFLFSPNPSNEILNLEKAKLFEILKYFRIQGFQNNLIIDDQPCQTQFTLTNSACITCNCQIMQINKHFKPRSCLGQLKLSVIRHSVLTSSRKSRLLYSLLQPNLEDLICNICTCPLTTPFITKY